MPPKNAVLCSLPSNHFEQLAVKLIIDSLPKAQSTLSSPYYLMSYLSLCHILSLFLLSRSSLSVVSLHVSLSLSLTVSNVRHGQASLEAPAHAAVDTLGLPPARVLDPHKAVTLMPRKLLGALLHHIDLVQGLYTTHGCAVGG